MKRIKYVYFYFLFLLYLIVGFFGDVPLIKKGIYENLYNYMGFMLIPTLFFFVLYGFVFMIENKKKRFFWELRLYYIYILFFIIAYIFILANLGINFGTAPGFEINADFDETVIDINCLRALSRECEVAAVDAFYKEGKTERVDMLKALNRLSSILYLMMLKANNGDYKS